MSVRKEIHEIVPRDHISPVEIEEQRVNAALEEPRFDDVEQIVEGRQYGVFDNPSYVNHDSIHFFRDEATGLRAIVAIHDSLLGPSLGGARVFPYKSEAEAIFDVLRLSRGMTFKAACAGLPLGGGKAIIFGPLPEHPDERAAAFRRFGGFVNSLGGRYVTAEDVGTLLCDMVQVRSVTDHVVGIPTEIGGSGNPGPYTAHGVYVGMKEAVKFRLGKTSLRGIKVLVEGIGSVGSRLLEKLAEEDAELYVTDVNEKAVDRAVKRFGAQRVHSDEKFDAEVDVYSPNALGGVLNDQSIPRLRAAVVAGAANNQLLDAQPHAQALLDRGICYTPDYICNAGGLINVSLELTKQGWSHERSMNMLTTSISSNLSIVFRDSQSHNISSYIAAKQLAIARLNKAAYDQGSHKTKF
jgi:leucine dehydrogenase